MTMTQITYVLHTAREKNISKAAENLFVSQSALSQQIQKLEQELGYRIFERTARGLQLTQEGEVFCTQATPLLEHWQAFQKTVRPVQSTKKQHMYICMGARVYSNGLFQDVMEFFDEHEQMEATFVTDSGGDFLTGLRDGSLDLAIDRLPSENLADDTSEFYTCVLAKERQCVLMSRDDPRAGNESITFRDLQGATMISGLENSSEDKMLKKACKDNHFTFDRIFRSDGVETSMNLVRRGKGVALGPRSFAHFYNIAAVDLTPPLDIALRFICLKDSLRRKEVQLFCDYMRKSCIRRGLLEETEEKQAAAIIG